MSRRNTGFPMDVKELVEDRSGGCCELCGESARADGQYHHRRARGMGSTKRADTNAASNCLLLCLMCHNRVESYRTDAYENGWLVRSQQSPIATPVLYRGRLVLLGDDGYTYPIPTRKEA